MVLVAVCLGAYVSNGDFLPGNDQVGNMLFSINLLKRHSLTLGPTVAPEAFFWTIEEPGQTRSRHRSERGTRPPPRPTGRAG